jgi:hypothetical protein
MIRFERGRSALGVLALVALLGAAPDSTRDGRFELPPDIRSFYDSLLTLPDSALRELTDVTGQSPAMLRTFARRLLFAPESIYAGPDSAHRTDAEMTATFFAHEREFERLARMFRADTAFDRVAAPGWRTPNPPRRMPAARQQEYDRLFALLGVRAILRVAPEHFLLRTTTVWTFDRRGYEWSPRPPRRLVDRETLECDDCCRRIKGPWYVYFQSSS